MTLEQWLTWIVGGGGSAAITYWLLERLALDVTPETKRYLSLALACLLASAAFVASVVLDYQLRPVDAQKWFEALFSIWFIAVTGSQIIHGRLRLR